MKNVPGTEINDARERYASISRRLGERGRESSEKALWVGLRPDGPSDPQGLQVGYKLKYGKLPELGEDVMPDAEAEAADEVSSAGESSDSD